MARDARAVLSRLRDAAVEEVSKELAEARARARREMQRLDDHCLCMQREQSEAGSENVVTLVTWMEQARRRTERLQAVLLNEETQTLRLQQVLLHRRTEAAAVAKAMQRRAAKERVVQARKDQAIMDEAAGRSGRHDAVVQARSDPG